MTRISKMIKEYRTAEFVKLSRLIMLWVGAPVIVFWSIMDYQEWGFKAFWLIFRLSFPLYAMACVYLAKLPIFNGPRRHQIPFVIYTAYILICCSYFISQSGYANSRYLVGLPQIVLSMSFLPFGLIEFLIIAFVYSAIPILVATKGLADVSLFASSAFQLYITYSMFAVLTYFVVDFIRKTSFENKALLFLEKEAQQTLIDSQSRELAETRVSVAIAATVQMLAHDVRKPFTILKMGLGMLGRARDPSEVKGVLSRLVPEIDKAMQSVDGMIADVMEIGSTSNELIQEPASVESLIENTLGEIFRVYPKSNVEIVYDLKHASMAHVHVIKVGRVLSNIVGNAVQAIGYNGKIWFRTREKNAQIEFCIGNAGSFIPVEDIPKLFEAFFTYGKKGGTGLGLAIAQKVIAAHGGRIWCESSKGDDFPNGIVEFYFTLPISTGRAGTTTAHLPTHSSEIGKAFLSLSGKDETHSYMRIDKNELTLEDEIIAGSKQLGRPIKVLVIDDEAIYRSALAQSLSRTKALAAAVTLHEADGSVKALLKLKENSFDLVVTDVDMGANSLTGFELVQLMARDLMVPALICVHSNRIVAADHKTAMECGADAFLPKPMARSHLLKLVLQAEQKSETAKDSDVSAKNAFGRPEVLVVDDNAFVLSAWEDMLSDDALVYLIDSPEALLAKITEEPGFLSRLHCVITDNNFDGSQGDGIDVGRLVKQNHPSLAVFLSSDGQFSEVDFGGSIDCLIDKNPVPLRNLPVNLA